MSKEKFLSYAASAIEITKMVLVISANTAIKLFYEGKKEVIKQYVEYNEKSYYKQKETLEKLKAFTHKAESMKPKHSESPKSAIGSGTAKKDPPPTSPTPTPSSPPESPSDKKKK